VETEAQFVEAILAQAFEEKAHKAVEWIEKDWFVSALWRQVIVAAKDVIGSGRPCTKANIVTGFPWEPEQLSFIQDLDPERGRGTDLHLMASSLRDSHREKQYRILISELACLQTKPKEMVDQALRRFAEMSASLNEEQLRVRSVLESMRLADSQKPLLPQEMTSNIVITGIKTIDEYVRMSKKSMGVVAAVTSAGKSTLAIQMATRSAVHGVKSLIVSLEMDHEEIHAKAMSHLTGVPSFAYLTGRHAYKFTQEEADVFANIQTISCGSGTSWPPLEAIIRNMYKVSKLDVVYVDYLTLLEPPEHGKSSNLAQRFGELSKAMRRLSQDLSICVVLVCQFNRQAEDGAEPQLNQLRESGQIENDCNWAILLWNEDKSAAKSTEIRNVKYKIPKNRGGKRGMEGRISFDPERNVFYDPDSKPRY
jgi:replicative DNA helicase